jgi:hypothetical protein
MILNDEQVPPTVYNEHVYITQDNTVEFCPEFNTTEGV